MDISRENGEQKSVIILSDSYCGDDMYMQEIKERHILYIDILKAIACICVVIGHVIAGIAKAGIDISKLLLHIHTYVYLFHVPCFFFASGYLYGNKRVSSWYEYVFLIMKKLLVLGVPYLVCTGLYVAISSFLRSEMNANTSYSLHEVLNIWKIPIAHYWYLYALIGIFVFVPAVELIFKKVSRIYLWIGFVLLTLWKSEIVCVNYITQYAYLFYLGVIWNISDRGRRENHPGNMLTASGGGYTALHNICFGSKRKFVACGVREPVEIHYNDTFGCYHGEGIVCNC